MVNAVTHILDNNSTIRTLIGLRSSSETEYKVFPVVVFETEKAPYIVVRQTGQVSKGKNCGHDYSIDVISYATSYDAVQALSAAVRSAIEGQASGTVNGVDYGYLNFANEQDGDFVKEILAYSRITSFEGYGG